jgi:hypothetical protein
MALEIGKSPISETPILTVLTGRESTDTCCCAKKSSEPNNDEPVGMVVIGNEKADVKLEGKDESTYEV